MPRYCELSMRASMSLLKRWSACSIRAVPPPRTHSGTVCPCCASCSSPMMVRLRSRRQLIKDSLQGRVSLAGRRLRCAIGRCEAALRNTVHLGEFKNQFRRHIGEESRDVDRPWLALARGETFGECRGGDG